MKYVRFLTYALLLAALVVAWKRKPTILEAELVPPTYDVQAAALLPRDSIARGVLSPNSRLTVSGGLPAGTSWQFREGPDFDVWGASFRAHDTSVDVGVYVGWNPRVRPPRTGLEPGVVGGVPVLWWKHEDEGYRTAWDALIPRGAGESHGYVHIWISSYHPGAVSDAVESLKTLELRVAAQPPNKSARGNAHRPSSFASYGGFSTASSILVSVPHR